MSKASLTSMLVLGAVSVALSVPAVASISWNFNSQCGGFNNTSTSAHGNSATCSSGGTTLTATAWANTGGTSTANNAAAQTLQDAALTIYSGGFGVANRDRTQGGDGNGTSDIDNNEGTDPEHAVDNQQRYDSLRFSFSEALALTSVTLGWFSNDHDLTVLYYDGAGAPSWQSGQSTSNPTYAELTGASGGWKLLGHFADGLATASGGTRTFSFNEGAAQVSSSYWLVGAYNPAVGGGMTGTHYRTGYDYVKVAAISGVKPPPPPPPSQVPVPGTLWLLSLGLPLVGRFRRRA